MAAGTATLDFTTTPKPETSLAITGQASILSGSRVEAWVRLEASANNTLDEILNEDLLVLAGNIVPSTGFTIYVKSRMPPTRGQFKIDWVWI